MKKFIDFIEKKLILTWIGSLADYLRFSAATNKL